MQRISSGAVKLELSEQLQGLPAGGHLCLFYEKDPAEQMPALIPFIRESLLQDEQFIYVADDQTVDELANCLQEHGIDVARESRCERLKLHTRNEWRQPGRLDSQKKAQQVREYIDAAAQAGFKGIRFAVEMTWTLGPDINVQDLEHWEATINTLFQPSFPGRIICQYNRARLAPDVLIAALHTHLVAIIGTEIYPNPFYEAPFILNGNGNGHGKAHSRNGNGNDNGDHREADSARVEWMLTQLERARIAERDRLGLYLEREARLEAEQAKRRAESSEQRLRAFVEHCPECVKLIRRDGTLAEMNAAGLRMIEADSAQQIIGKSVFDLIAPEDRQRFKAMHRQVCNGASAQMEFFLLGLRGTRRWIEAHAAPIPDPDEPGFLHLAITRDISERRRADLVSRRLSAIVESSDDAIVSKDLNGIIATWNAGAERIFGYTAQEAIGKPVTLLVPRERHNEESGILGRIAKGQRIDHYETVRRRKDGTYVDISLTVSPVRDPEGRIIGASKIARDISARKRADNELRATKDELARLNEDLERRVRERTASLTEAIAQMEEYSYTISHDLRAPARAMTGYAKIVLQDFGKDLHPDAKEYLERIIRGGGRMDRLVQDVLTYSRLSRQDLDLQPVSLDKLISEIVQQYPEMQPPRAVISLRSPLLNVRAHEPSLAQSISNLLSNAVKFVPRGEVPKVTVRSEAHGGKVCLWVEDNGIGIKPEHQHRIFGVFERLPNSIQYEGTGIGLAIVRKAAEKMSGAAGVESDGLTGSRFWIELPAAENH